LLTKITHFPQTKRQVPNVYNEQMAATNLCENWNIGVTTWLSTQTTRCK